MRDVTTPEIRNLLTFAQIIPFHIAIQMPGQKINLLSNCRNPHVSTVEIRTSPKPIHSLYKLPSSLLPSCECLSFLTLTAYMVGYVCVCLLFITGKRLVVEKEKPDAHSMYCSLLRSGQWPAIAQKKPRRSLDCSNELMFAPLALCYRSFIT